jgi:hypothetical protein
MALSFDGTTIAVTAPNYADSTGLTIGQTVVYSMNKHKKWIKSGTFSGGASVALSYDGTILVIGSNPVNASNLCSFETTLRPCPTNGTVTVYHRTRKWSQLGSVLVGASPGFGYTVALSSNGTVLVVGAPQLYYDVYTASATIFQWNGSDWQILGNTLYGSNTTQDEFGYDVAISADGSIVAIGDPFVLSYTSVEVFTYNTTSNSSSTSGGWVMLGNIFYGASGQSFALSADGLKIASGAIINPHHANVLQLSLYQFNSTNYSPPFSYSYWSRVGSGAALKALGINNGDSFQISLSADGTIVAGIFARSLFHQPSDAGVFQVTNGTWIQIGNDIHGAQSLSLSRNGKVLAVSTMNGIVTYQVMS